MNHEDYVRAYIAWKLAPFPEGAADDDLDEMHADLVYVDAMVAEIAIPLIERGFYVPEFDIPGQARRELAAIISHEKRNVSSGIEDDRSRLLSRYYEYAAMLSAVIKYVDLLLECDGRPLSD